jgi:acyl-CoA synthetase (AMP-forming)/AMP-acid ligase II
MSPRGSLFDIGPPPPCPARFNTARWVLRHAADRAGETALRVLDAEGAPRETWTFADLDRAIRATAAGLRAAGLRPGERVALRLGNVSDFPILFFGTIAAGGIAVPTSAQLTEGEFARLAADMAPRFVAVADELALSAPPPGPSCAPTRRGRSPAPARTTPPSSSTPPAPADGRRASCTPSARPGRGR